MIVMAGARGAAVRVAEVLGANHLAYVATCFIASHESGAPPEFKQMLVDAGVGELLYTANPNGVSASWLKPSFGSADSIRATRRSARGGA